MSRHYRHFNQKRKKAKNLLKGIGSKKDKKHTLEKIGEELDNLFGKGAAFKGFNPSNRKTL